METRKIIDPEIDPAAVMREKFDVPRDPRSDEYKAGCRAALEFRKGVNKAAPCPYKTGTAQADAWFAGWDEGRSYVIGKREGLTE